MEKSNIISVDHKTKAVRLAEARAAWYLRRVKEALLAAQEFAHVAKGDNDARR